MATVYQCDRCSKLAREQAFLTDVVVPAIAPAGDMRPEVEQVNAGICPDCLSELHEWIKPLAIKPGVLQG